MRFAVSRPPLPTADKNGRRLTVVSDGLVEGGGARSGPPPSTTTTTTSGRRGGSGGGSGSGTSSGGATRGVVGCGGDEEEEEQEEGEEMGLEEDADGAAISCIVSRCGLGCACVVVWERLFTFHTAHGRLYDTGLRAFLRHIARVGFLQAVGCR